MVKTRLLTLRVIDLAGMPRLQHIDDAWHLSSDTKRCQSRRVAALLLWFVYRLYRCDPLLSGVSAVRSQQAIMKTLSCNAAEVLRRKVGAWSVCANPRA
jgi:hypothetical protein